MPSVVLTRPGVAFTDAKSKPDEQLLLKSSKTPGTGGRFGTPKSTPFPVEEDEDETQIVPYGESIAIGTEATRSYGGPEAVFAMLYTARSEAARTCAEQRQRDLRRSAFDGTLRFGLAPKIGAALNDQETRDALFEACGRNWRECLERPEEVVGKIRALWLQGTRGDCDEPEPTDLKRRLLWRPWFELMGFR
jgi:acyl-CoA-binding protein